MIWANCLFSFNFTFLLRKVEDVMTIIKSQSLTSVSIKDCTLRIPNETTTFFLLRVMIKTIFIHAGAFFLILSLSLAYGKGLRHVSQYLVCSFVPDVLVQIIHSTTPVLFTRLRCILHVTLCCDALCVTCSVVRVIEYFVLSAHLVSLDRACVMVGGNTYVFCTVTKGLHVWGGI